MRKRVLITGVKGMAGSHLLDRLVNMMYEENLEVAPEFDIVGIDLADAESFIEGWPNHFRYFDCDVRNFQSLISLFRLVKPEWVFHLAAEPFVADSWKDPDKFIETNITGTVHVLECARLMDEKPIVQIACSSEEYGKVYSWEVPIDHKSQPFRPLSTYGVTKVAAELLGYQYHKSYGLRTVMTRTFNHTGPRQKRLYVTSDFCAMAVEIQKGKRKVIQHGNLDAVRDFTDVRDIVRGYISAMQWVERTGIGGTVFQLGGGAVISIKELLRWICDITGVEHTEWDESRMRPSDVPFLCADSGVFFLLTGWKPEYSFEQTLMDVLEYWKGRI